MLEILFPSLIVDTIEDIDLKTLQKNNIKGLVIDIDNTLVAWDIKEADQKAMRWIEYLKSQGIKVCLVSNNTEDRVVKFNENLNLFAVHRANKPRKEPFLKALKHLELRPEETAVVGDQVFTDVLGGNRLKMFTILVTPISQKEFPLIKLKRFFEKMVLRSYEKKLSRR
ncbi:YqeG family HAD IIIA-type phosphatase [Petroclostridium sp. X23]|uniref:YqeG family HAD IIIA-type phosphatase n=1 Tax=Petroclostridium sp. X23 TaxID=3045146 RepID=UPI0024AE759E|nr:YqeG family HAD IIIA-type phosphatase [Petroclostridium sp. X23]WHH59670.1 YqeG family HAD IIIA-type phosphatase [Petroclostridium sp. X23]